METKNIAPNGKLLFALKQMDYYLFMKSLLPKDGKNWLAIDRTNWKFVKTDINMLIIIVIYKEIAFPLCWMALEKFRNSSSSERIVLLNKAVNILEKESTKGKLGDRVGVREQLRIRN